MAAPTAFLVNAFNGDILKMKAYPSFPIDDTRIYDKKWCWWRLEKNFVSNTFRFTNTVGCIINIIDNNVIFSDDPTKQYPIQSNWYISERDEYYYINIEDAKSDVNKITVKPRHLYYNGTELSPIESPPEPAPSGKVYYCIIGKSLIGPLTDVYIDFSDYVYLRSSENLTSRNITGLMSTEGQGKWKIKYDKYENKKRGDVGSQKWYMVDENKNCNLVYKKAEPTQLTYEQNAIILNLIEKTKDRNRAKAAAAAAEAEANRQPSGVGGSRKKTQKRSKKNKRRTNKRRR